MVYRRNPTFLKGVVAVSGIVIVFGLALYPIVIHPRLHPEYYRMLNVLIACIYTVCKNIPLLVYSNRDPVPYFVFHAHLGQ